MDTVYFHCDEEPIVYIQWFLKWNLLQSFNKFLWLQNIKHNFTCRICEWTFRILYKSSRHLDSERKSYSNPQLLQCSLSGAPYVSLIVVSGVCGPEFWRVLAKVLMAFKPGFTGMWKTVNMIWKCSPCCWSCFHGGLIRSALTGKIPLCLNLQLFPGRPESVFLSFSSIEQKEWTAPQELVGPVGVVLHGVLSRK